MGGVPGANGQVLAAVIDGSGNLYIGGEFTVAGKTIANNIAEWNGSSWSALGSGMSRAGIHTPLCLRWRCRAAHCMRAALFTTAGGSAANNIAQWNGSSWSALGEGIGGSYPSVSALAVSGSTLYAGGEFTTAGGSTATNIAQWNGSSWSPLGSGMDGTVSALAVSGGTLYAGGNFTTAGGSAANYIAQWNGSSWAALGSGINHDVEALAVSGSTLYAGGYFTTAGGSAANDIAQWNGSSWSPLGSGISGGGPVSVLVASGGTLYAGGAFADEGAYPSDIQEWNGSSWSNLGFGMNGPVYALAVSGGTVYAGGYFNGAQTVTGGVVMSDGVPANNIAQWNGSSWSALGAGILGEDSPYGVAAPLFMRWRCRAARCMQAAIS